MKKIALLAAFFCLFASMTRAQSNWDGTGFRFGLQASPGISWMHSSDSKNLEGAGTNLGLKLGVLAENYFSPNYALVSGIGFGFNPGGTIQYGYTGANPWPDSDLTNVSRADSLPSNTKLHYRMTYVEIPVALRMRGGSGTDSPLAFFAEAPVFTLGFTTKSLGDIRSSTIAGQNDNIDVDIRKDVNGLSLSWGIGAGIEYEVAAHATLTAGLYYQDQFTDLTSDKGEVFKGGQWVEEDAKTSFRAVTLRIGVYF